MKDKTGSSNPMDHDMVPTGKVDGFSTWTPAPKEISKALDQAFSHNGGDNDPLQKLNDDEIQKIRWNVLQFVYPLIVNRPNRIDIAKVLMEETGEMFPVIYHETDTIDKLFELMSNK